METIYTHIKNLAYILCLFLGMKSDVVKVLFILMVLDSILGIIKALRLGNKFSFKVLLWGVITKLAILIIPMVLALMAKSLSFDFKYFVVAVLNIIIVSEGISCITNILSIKTKKQIENTDYITMLLETLKRILSGIIKKLFEALEIKKSNNN